MSILRSIACFFGGHRLRKDPRPVNGVWWAFCEHCGARYGGEYDMATGETHWRAQ
jgi:hypothetical protein